MRRLEGYFVRMSGYILRNPDLCCCGACAKCRSFEVCDDCGPCTPDQIVVEFSGIDYGDSACCATGNEWEGSVRLMSSPNGMFTLNQASGYPCEWYGPGPTVTVRHYNGEDCGGDYGETQLATHILAEKVGGRWDITFETDDPSYRLVIFVGNGYANDCEGLEGISPNYAGCSFWWDNEEGKQVGEVGDGTGSASITPCS